MTLFSQTFSGILCNLTKYELLIHFTPDFIAILRSYNQKTAWCKIFFWCKINFLHQVVFPLSWPRVRNSPNDQKWAKMIKNDQNYQNYQIYQKWSKMIKITKFTKNDQKWSKLPRVTKNYQIFFKIQKWLERLVMLIN